VRIDLMPTPTKIVMRLATREQKVNARLQHTSCGAQNSVLEAEKPGFWDALGAGSPDLAYSCFNSIAA
jgi:hypothetical protein